MACATEPKLDLRAVWQLTSMSVGAGVFTIPAVFVQLGVLHAALWVAALAALADIAMQRLLDAAAEHCRDSYEGLAELAFGGAGKVAVSAITVVTTFIASLSYVSAGKELLLNLAVAFILDVDVNSAKGDVRILDEGRSTALLAVLVAAVLPLCLSPTMGGNAWISKFGVVCMFSAAAFFVVRCCLILAQGCSSGIQCGQKPAAFAGSALDMLEFTATLASSFSVIFALFPVLQDRIAESNLQSAVPVLRRSVRCSVFLCFVLYCGIGVVGAATFGSRTKGIALSNLPLSEQLTQLITLMVGTTVVLLVGIVSFPTVKSLELLVASCTRAEMPSPRLRPCLVVAIGVAMVLVDAFLPTKVAFTLCGSLGMSMGAYVMPCMIFFRLGGTSQGTGSRMRAAVRLSAVVVLLFGYMLLFGSTPITLVRLIGSKSAASSQALLSLICGATNVGHSFEA